jgi:ethanolamine ammonia-lyase small subunit
LKTTVQRKGAITHEMNKKNSKTEYPIADDYLKKLRTAKTAKLSATRARLKAEATALLGVMTAAAAQVAIDKATEEGLFDP